ncbi:MAG: NAD(P)H-hydrate epimerase, partial [Flavobacteriales bacterium]|nr:NAD(P)H-hydrate epimerase [Flavobacteriales bacterium]
MKILSAEQVAEADAYTIAHEPVKSIDLMERAARACFDWIIKRYDKTKEFKIFSGVGNNGGDGLVIARLLSEKGYKVHVFVISFSDKASPDFTTNLQRFKKLNPAAHTTLTTEKAEIDTDWGDVVIVDAIFGSGLNRRSGGIAADVISLINQLGAEVISIDVPSGLFVQDNQQNDAAGIIKATFTLSLELPKLAFMFSENRDCVGDWCLIPIGLDQGFIESQDSNKHYTRVIDVRSLIKSRGAFSHKGTFGHA